MLIPVAALILFLPFPYFCSLSFSSFTLIPHSLLFPIFPQSRSASFGFTPVFVLHPYTRIRSYFRFSPNPVPLSSGFTPVFVLHPYTRIRSYFRFSPNPAPLLPALLLFPSFILIPAFALIDIFTPYSFFYGLNVCISRQMQTCRSGRKACAASGRAFEFRNG